MTDEDLTFGLALGGEAGWNQLPADWRRCIDLQPDGCFVATLGEKLAGTTTVCVFDEVAWVAMVLVDPRFRRQGVGRALMEHALAFLDQRGVRTVRLDATPAGRPLYEQLGFVAQFDLIRFAGVLPPSPRATPTKVVAVPCERWPELVALDTVVTSTERGRFLLRLFSERPEDVRGVEGESGWRGLMTVRAGARAMQLGPCEGEAGAALLLDAWTRHTGQTVFLDAPEGHAEAVEFADCASLTVQRRLTRMVRGAPIVEDVARLWASSGPEKG